MHAYLGNRIGNRKIELALQEQNLESFYLDVYVLPIDLIKDKKLPEIKNFTLLLEQYYILMFNPEYNVLKVAGSSSGRVLSEETKKKMSLRALNRVMAGEKKPLFGLKHSEETIALMASLRKGKNLSEETKAKIYSLLSGDKHPLFGKERSKETKDKIMLARKSRLEIEVLYLETNSKTVYPSVRAAAKYLGLSSTTIDSYFKNTTVKAKKRPCKGRYVFSKVSRE